MSIIVTRPGKNQLVLENPVMPAAGTFGLGAQYRSMVNLDKLGALVTNPVSYRPHKAANGPRTVPLDAGVLLHTGLPNPGISKLIKQQRDTWRNLSIPVVLHLIATTPEDVRKSMTIIDNSGLVAAVELGLPDDLTVGEAVDFTRAATQQAETPVLVRLPLYDAYAVAEAVADAGAGALVVAAPPRGTARDLRTGAQVNGRVYGPLIKTMTLHLVERLAARLPEVPIVGSGGVHTAQDARDYISAGAVAVQVGSVTWVLPRAIELIARDLGGLVLTRKSDALADEWFTGMGKTDRTDFNDRS